MPTFTVREIRGSRPWPSAEDTKRVYYDLFVEGENRPVNVGRKPGNPVNVGDTLEGTIEPDDRGGLKLVVPQSQNGRGGGGFRPRDPKESKRIATQASHKVAVDILRLAAEVGAYEKPENVAAIVNQVKTITNVLVAQVEEAGA